MRHLNADMLNEVMPAMKRICREHSTNPSDEEFFILGDPIDS